jgi:creatinine amidohydrolase
MRRRTFVGTVAAAALWGVPAPAVGGESRPEPAGTRPALSKEAVPSAGEPGPEPAVGVATGPEKEVRLEYLRPREIEQAMEACPVLFQPLGTIEWHGRHNVVGLDAVKAQMLCIRAARRAGGLVAPPLFGGVGGLDQPHTFVIEPENDVFSALLRPWVEKLCREAVRQGFRAVIMLTGHYGAAQQIVVREAAVRMSRVLGVPVLGTPEYFLAMDVGYLGDHAAWGETSLMMHLDPPSVDLSQLGEAPHQGVGGRDPKKYATPEDGRKLAETIIARLAALAQKMPTWDAATRQRFIDAEAALVHRQIALAAEQGTIWAGWRNVSKGALSDYGRLLVDGQFDQIIALVEKL